MAAVASRRFDARIAAQKSDVTVQIFQFSTVTMFWCRFVLFFGFRLSLAFCFAGEIVFFFFLVVCSHHHRKNKQMP